MTVKQSYVGVYFSSLRNNYMESAENNDKQSFKLNFIIGVSINNSDPTFE